VSVETEEILRDVRNTGSGRARIHEWRVFMTCGTGVWRALTVPRATYTGRTRLHVSASLPIGYVRTANDWTRLVEIVEALGAPTPATPTEIEGQASPMPIYHWTWE
jgi:hypothetical protein